MEQNIVIEEPKKKRKRSSMMVFLDTKERLRKLKIHPRESFDDELNRMIVEWEEQ